jgi:hypothetical protein
MRSDQNQSKLEHPTKVKRLLILIGLLVLFFGVATGLCWLHDLHKFAVERRVAEESKRRLELAESEWRAKQDENMRQFKESIRKEAEARAQVQDATHELEDLGRRDPAVAARNKASRKRVEEIRSGQAKGFEEFHGTRDEAQLIADQERLGDMKQAIARRQEAQQLLTPTATPRREEIQSEVKMVPTPPPPPVIFVTITKTLQKSQSGSRVTIPAGAKVQMISRRVDVVQVRYGGESVFVPITSRDLK